MNQYRFGEQSETFSELPEQERPTFNEIQENAEAGIVKRGISRYLFSRNPERSVKMYKYLGIPILRRAIMGTYGRFIPRSSLSNYRTDSSKTMIERSMRFAVGGSVINEGAHTFLAVMGVQEIFSDIADGRSPTHSALRVGFNSALVGLQRYNRARMAQRITEEMEAGRTFDPEYKNWLGIDGRAVENYEYSLSPEVAEQLPSLSQVIEERSTESSYVTQ